MNYFELHIGDYLKKTFGLSSLEHGIYFRLLLYYYSEERPLPNDIVAIYALCSATSTKERQAIDRIIARYFITGEDGLRHNRKADEVIGSYQKRSVANSRNGRLGGLARARNSLDNSLSENVASQSPVPSNQKPVTSNQGKREGARPQTYDEVTALFEERSYPPEEAVKFWNFYEANGWVQGRNKPLKNWKAAAAGWVSRSKEFQPVKIYSNGKPKSPTVQESVTNAAALGSSLEAIAEEHRRRNSG